jgi:hypothetical protein
MNKTLSISLLSFAAMSIVITTSLFVNSAGPSSKATASSRPANRGQLPAGLAIPPALPSSIQDPILMEAWVRLYNHQDAIQLWDGSTLTGRALAQYLLEHAIPVVWDVDNVCRSGSCSVRYCSAGACAFDDGKPGIDPIYVRPAERDDMPALGATLAHEAFHRTQPFGAVADTRFEEYWAFRIEYHITAEAWLNFGAYDPLDSNHLNLWIRENRLDPYFQLEEYPVSIQPLVYRSNSTGGDPYSGIPAEAMGTSEGSSK